MLVFKQLFIFFKVWYSITRVTCFWNMWQIGLNRLRLFQCVKSFSSSVSLPILSGFFRAATFFDDIWSNAFSTMSYKSCKMFILSGGCFTCPTKLISNCNAIWQATAVENVKTQQIPSKDISLSVFRAY